jgi:HPt (histidine-containing phosphotransfer) domain-containing protein
MAALRRAVGIEAADDAMRSAHTLKGSMGHLGARQGFDLAYQLERVAREGHLADAPRLLAALEGEMAEVTAALLGYLRGDRSADS